MNFSLAGLYAWAGAPQWALSNDLLHWISLQTLLVGDSTWDVCDSLRGAKAIEESVSPNLNYSNLLTGTTDESLSQAEKLQGEQKDRLAKRKNFSEKSQVGWLLNIDKTIHEPAAYSFHANGTILSDSEKGICQGVSIGHSSSVSGHPIDARSIAGLGISPGSIVHSEKTDADDCAATATRNKPLNLVISLKEDARGRHTYRETKDRFRHSSIVAGDTRTVDGEGIFGQRDRSPDVRSSHAKYKNIDYGLLKLSDLDELSKCNSDLGGRKLSETLGKLFTGERSNDAAADDLKQERAQILDRYVTHVLPPRLSESKPRVRSSWPHPHSNVKCNNIKKESCTEEEAHKSENTDPVLTACNPATLGNWACFEMSGQYPGHSRPPVGTPPPQTVWNHLTMAQGQGN